MEKILETIKPIFLNYQDDFNEFVTPKQACEIIEDLDENTEQSYREVFKSNLLQKKIYAKDIAQWIFTKREANGGGILALLQIAAPRYISLAKEMLQQFQIELKSKGKPKEASILFSIGEMATQESKLELQFILGGKQNKTLSEFELIKGCPAFIFSISCENSEVAQGKLEDIIANARDFLIDTLPAEIAQIIEIIEIKIIKIGNNKIAIALYFPVIVMEQLTKEVNEFISQFIGEGENELLIDLDFSSSLNLKKFIVDKEKQMSDVLFDDEQSLKLLFKILLPGPLCGNAQMTASILLNQFFGDDKKQFIKYSNMIAPLFLIQQFALAFNFLSLEEFIERGEDVEIVEDFIDSGIKNTPQEFKEHLNNKYQIKEMFEKILNDLPIFDDLLQFLKNQALMDFELILQVSELRFHLVGKSEGCKEAFDFIMEDNE